MQNAMGLVVRTGENHGILIGGFGDGVEWIVRKPREHSGWQSVTYEGRRYKLWGGIRTNFWINLSMPIPTKKDKES
jgi:hypothetical protein